MISNPKVGDRVQYSSPFVRSCGCSKEIADLRGTIIEVKKKVGKSYHVKLQWDDEDELRGCLSENLHLSGKFEPFD